MRLKKVKTVKHLEFYSADSSSQVELPLYAAGVSAGFPSPAEDYVDMKLDLNKFLIKHPSATFYVRVQGHSMQDAGIQDGDLLIVDRSITPKNNDIAICVLNGEFTVKRLRKKGDELYLVAENEAYKPIKVDAEAQFEVWGVVSYIIKKV